MNLSRLGGKTFGGGLLLAFLLLGGPLKMQGQAKTDVALNSKGAEYVVFARSDQPASAERGAAAIVNDPALILNFSSRYLELMLKDGTALSDLKLRATDPAFSRDGKRIALSSNQNSNRFQISVMNLVDRKVAQLTHFQSGDALGPVWSPDDKQIAFYAFRYSNPSREPELYVMDADGGNVRKLADHASEPSWSPDGKSIAFTSAAGGKFDIAVIRIDGSNRKQLTQETGENSAPAWSPDGSTIAFSSDRQGRNAVYLMNPDGTEQQRFVFSKKEEFCFAAWSRGNDVLAFTSLIPNITQMIVAGEELPKCQRWAGAYQIYSVGSDGKNLHLLSPKTGGLKPSFGIVAP